MISLNHIARISALRNFVVSGIFSVLMSACVSTSVTSPSRIEAVPNAITLPYKISDAGHLVIDVAVNGHAARPFIIDSGANASAIYETYASDFDLAPSGKFTEVSGLVSKAVRPVAEDVTLQIGAKSFQRGRVVMLESQSSTNEAVGLLGVDVLADYAVLFNKSAMMATLIPSEDVSGDSFSGWRKIPLRNHVGFYPDKNLYFARIILKDSLAPVLVDTGSELNFVNWELASEDEEIEKLHRRLRRLVKLEGAVDTAPLRIQAVYYDVQLGKQSWPEVPVTVLEFDTLSDFAPVDEPMMLAGVGLFSSSTFAFDFGGNAIYILDEDSSKTPKFTEESEDHLEPIWDPVN